MKTLHALSLLLLIAFAGNAQLVVTQPDELARRLVVARTQPEVAAPAAAAEASVEEAASVPGYRVQLFSGNSAHSAKATADYRAAAVQADFPQWPAYVTFAAPYWRLRVGDFRSYEEARAAHALLRKQYPTYAGEMRLVRDKVKPGK